MSKRKITPILTNVEQAIPSPTKKKKRRSPRPPKFDRYVNWLEKNNFNKDMVDAFEEVERQGLSNDLGNERLTFGKYKGEKFIDLWTDKKKKSYLEWMGKQKDMFEDVKEILVLLKEKYPE